MNFRSKALISVIMAGIITTQTCLPASAIVMPGTNTIIDFSDIANQTIKNSFTTSDSNTKTIVDENETSTTNFINEYFYTSLERDELIKNPTKCSYLKTTIYSKDEVIETLKKIMDGSIYSSKPVVKYIDVGETKDYVYEIAEKQGIKSSGKSGSITDYVPNASDYVFATTEEIRDNFVKDNNVSNNPQITDFYASNYDMIMNIWRERNNDLINNNTQYDTNTGDKWADFWYWYENCKEKWKDSEIYNKYSLQNFYDFWIWCIENDLIKYAIDYLESLMDCWYHLKDCITINGDYELTDVEEEISYVSEIMKIKSVNETTSETDDVKISCITEISAKSDTFRTVHTFEYLNNYEWYIYDQGENLVYYINSSVPWISFTPNEPNQTYTAKCYQSKTATESKYFDYVTDYYMYLTDTNALIYSYSVNGSQFISSEDSIIQEYLGDMDIVVGDKAPTLTLNVNSLSNGFVTQRLN